MELRGSDSGRPPEALYSVRGVWSGVQLNVNPSAYESVKLDPLHDDGGQLTRLTKIMKQLRSVGEQQLAEELQVTYYGRTDEDLVLDPAVKEMKEKIAVFRKKLYDLFIDAWTELENKPVIEMKMAIMQLSNPALQEYLESSLPSINDATSACDILSIPCVTDFITYGLLELLIQKLGTGKLKEKMEKYDKEFGDFAKGAKLNLFMQAWSGIKGGTHETESSILCSRQDKSWSHYTLQNARELHQIFCSESSLHPVIKSFLRFKHATNNGVTIEWLIPSRLISVLETEVKKMERVPSFRNLEILDLTLDGNRIFKAKHLTTILLPSELPTLLDDLKSVCDKWRAIGIRLHVPLGELDKIQLEGINDTDRLKRTLEDWIKNDRKATWFVLLDVLRRRVIQEEELANCLQTKYCLDPVESLIKSDLQCQYAVHNCEEDFYALFQTLRHTAQCEGGLKSLTMSVGAAGDTKPEIHRMVLALPCIAKAENVDEVLLDLYLHCDVLNCGLLRHICEHLRNQECQQKMGSYINELENLNNFKLQIFMKVWRGIRRASSDTSTLISKQKMSWDDYKINDAVRVKDVICEQASVPSQLIRLESIRDSDFAFVSVVWLLPKSIADKLKQILPDKHGDKAFQQLAIVQLIIDGDPVYKMDTEAAENGGVIEQGLKLMLKDDQYRQEILCDLSYAWTPFTESPSPDVIDRWIELSNTDVGFKHIRLEDVSDNLKTGIEAAEGSNAVALIVINDRDNHTLNQELVQCPSKGSFPVAVITHQDGKKIKEHARSKAVAVMLQTITEAPMLPNKVLLHKPLREELQELFIHKPKNLGSTPFQLVMALLDAYVQQAQGKKAKDGSEALQWILDETHNPSKLLADLPVYIGIFGHVVLNFGKYGEVENFVQRFGWRFEQLLPEPTKVSEVITDFLGRSDVPAIRRMNLASYAVLKSTCDSIQIRKERRKEDKFKSWFIPATMLWTTLTVKFHFQLGDLAVLCDPALLWKQFLLRDPELLSLNSNSVDSIVHGLKLGEELGVPAEASMMTHVEVLLAPQKDLRQFTELSYAIQGLSSFITTQQQFEKLLKTIYSSHCNWMELKRQAYIARTSKMAISGVICEGLQFVDAILKVWKWRSEGIDQICKDWLRLLLDLIKLQEKGASKLLHTIFHSEAEVVKKYKSFIVEKIQQGMCPEGRFLHLPYFYEIYKDVGRELGTKFLEKFLEDYKPFRNDTISRQLPSLNEFFSLVVLRLPSKDHHHLLSFIMTFRENYIKQPMQYALDLLKLDVKGNFEGSTFKFVQELHKILIHKRQSQELLKEILENLPGSGKNCYFQEHIVWKAMVEELVPSIGDLFGQKNCRAKRILELAVETVCDKPDQLSKRQEFCWAVVAHCCVLVSDKVKPQEFGWLTSYKYTIDKIAEIYDKFASSQGCPPSLSELPSYKTYIHCVERVQNVPKYWNQKLECHDFTYDEILLYLENFEVVLRIANQFIVTDFADQPFAEDLRKEFNTQFGLLSSYLVPFLDTHPAPVWCLLPDVLLEHNINRPSDPFDVIYSYVLLLRPKECSLTRQSTFEVTKSLDPIPLLERYGVQLTVSKTLTLEVMITLVEKLQRFVSDDLGHLRILVGSCGSFLIKEHIKLEMRKEPNSTPTIDLLKKALTATNSLVTKILNGSASIAEVTVNKTINLDELNLDREFNILAACEGSQGPSLKPNTLRRMLELFQLSSYIGSIEQVCQQYGLDGCLNDPNLSELVKIAKNSSQEGSDALTLNDINDMYKQASEYLCLKDDRSIRRLKVFKKVNESVDFYKFVEKKLFSGGQERIPSEKQIYRFQKLCDFICELHQDKRIAQHILGYVKVAFHYILPFMNKEQKFQGLMSAVMELEDASDFSELKAVTNFMDDIRSFFSTSHDAWQSVSAQLQGILNSGTYSFRTLPDEPALQPVVILEYTIPSEECHRSEVWDKDQILDFVNRLGLVDTKTGGEQEIQHFMTLYEIVLNLLQINIELRQLGHSDPNKVTPSVHCSIEEEEDARDLSSKAENSLRTWRDKVERLFQNHKWLLFFTPVKILEIYKAIQTGKSSRVAEEISFLFQNTTSTWTTLNEAVKDTLGHQQEVQNCSQMELVGKFLTSLFASTVVDVSSIALPKCIPQHTEVGAFVHIGNKYNQNQLVRLILKIFQGVPAPYSILRCCFSTNEEDLKLFMKRTQAFPGHYLILNVNQLSYHLQEVLLELYLQGSKQLKSRVDFIETSYSLFNEVPWIGTHTIHQDDGPSFSFEEAKTCFQNSLELKPFSVVELVCGSPGVGKTHYIRQRLQNIQSDYKVTIAVNEAFQRSVAVKKLKVLQPKASGCAIFFNFTLAPPTGQIRDSEMESYNELMDDIAWFLFELLVLGYVYDPATAKSFHIPAGCGWEAYVEVPSWMNSNELVENKVPALGLVGTRKEIQFSAPYCVDDDVQLVCSYLKAYESGEINTLVFEDLPVATMIHDLHPGLEDDHLLRNLYLWGVPSGVDPPIRNMILELYKTGLLKKLCLKGSKITFRPDEHSHLAEHECRNILDAYMPDCVKSNKIAQKLFVKYMKQRCNFLENFPGFCYNTGVGERKVNAGGAKKKNEYTNTVLLGSTLFETMLKEVEDFCDPSLKEDWTHQPHQQVQMCCIK